MFNNLYEEVYGEYYDTAGNYHWTGTESGTHILRKDSFSTPSSEFAVGDEVKYHSSSVCFIITSINKDGTLNGIGADGIAFCDKDQSKWIKTGRHFKEAEDLMDVLKRSL